MSPPIFDAPEFSRNLFFPRADTGRPPPGARDVTIAVAPSVTLHARIHAAPNATASVLLFHGNGEIVADYDDAAAAFHSVGATLAVVDFRGYGQSTGTPSLRAIIADTPVVLDALEGQLRMREVPLVVMGRSLGSACAAAAAGLGDARIAGLIVESGFTDLHALVKRRGLPVPPQFSSADLTDFDPLPKLARFRGPLLVLHGERDVLIAPLEGQAAYDAATAAARRLVLIPGRGHNDVSHHPLYFQAIEQLIRDVAVTRV